MGPMRVVHLILLAACVGCQPATPTAEPESEAVRVAAPAETPYDGPPKRVLVELFSSQGCNSCPAADAFVGELPAQGFPRADVVALTFHVTYWDDLGWQDPYAEALFDQRQIGYAQQLPAARDDAETTIRGPYTPQMVVDGKVHFSGALRDIAKAEIERARQQPTAIDIVVTVPANAEAPDPNAKQALDAAPTITVVAGSKLAEGSTLDTDRAKVGLFAALAQRVVETEVPRGENAGKKLIEHWVVRDFAGPKLFRSSRANETPFALERPDDLDPADAEVVVFAQDLSTLAILAVETTPVRPPG